MQVHAMVDGIYEAFVENAGPALAPHARGLARALRLVPIDGVPWSQVFGHEVTLGAPALFADAMPAAPGAVVLEAVRAHMFAVIDAFATDRMEDGQIPVRPEVLAVLGKLRRERDRALARIPLAAYDAAASFDAAERATRRAIDAERRILAMASPVDFETYESISLGKQTLGLVATQALARAAGWNTRRRKAVRAALVNVALGLQMHDDVVDWEDDRARGGAWAECLASGATTERVTSGGDRVRARVHASDVLARMIARARTHMRAARLRAAALGATRLSVWAGQREERLASLLAAERESAGYAVRKHALQAWAKELLA